MNNTVDKDKSDELETGEMLNTLVNDLSCGKSNILINSRAVGNYLKPAVIYQDAKDLIDEYVRIVLKLAYSQTKQTKEKSIRVTHLKRAFTQAALLVALDNSEEFTWRITKK